MILPDRDPEGVETEYLRRMGNFSGKRVLEIGCGNGRLTRRYAGLASQVVAIDLDQSTLQQALTSPEPFPAHVGFMQANATTLPYASNHFDRALFAWSL